LKIILGHLCVEEVGLRPTSEWNDPVPGWRFVRLSRGVAYWLGPTLRRELIEGEVVVLAPEVKGLIRASELTSVVLHTCYFQPSLLTGLMSLAERHYFEHVAEQSRPQVEFVPPTHPAALRFSELATAGANDPGIMHRGMILDMIGCIFGPDLTHHRPPEAPRTLARHRFHQLIEHMSDLQMIHYSSPQLAELCGLSARHFNRLFRLHFGVSPRSKQIELRLQKARQLLSATDDKIVNIAYESGFRNLGLFNELFKRHVGMTPSEWRERQRKKPKGNIRVTLISWAVGTLLALSAYAQEGAPAPTKSTFAVKGYELVGNTLLASKVTDPIFERHIGPAVTFDTIREAMAELKTAYLDRGYVTVSVALPQQQLTNGIVKIQILEGKLVEINVVNNRFFSSKNVRRALPSLHTNQIPNGLVLQQEFDRANANKDRQIYSVLGPGPEPGTSSLTLKIKDRLPLHARVDFNNNSTPDTPDLRLNVAAQYNNLFQLEHQIGVQYGFTPFDYKESAHPFYNLPFIANYSAFYRMPLSVVNGPPTRREPAVSDFGYDEATRRFRPPPLGDGGELLIFVSRSDSTTGDVLANETLTPAVVPPEGALQVSDRLMTETRTINEGLGLRLAHPLPQWHGWMFSWSGGLDWKSYQADTAQNRTFQATIFVPEVGQTGPPFIKYPSPPTSSQTNMASSVPYLPFTLATDISRPDKWGSTFFNIGLNFNWANLISDSQDFRSIAGSKQADGNYITVISGATRELKLYHDWGIRFHADGQWANQPLISNEQFGVGGLSGVRGYHEGELYGDTGWRVICEPHTPWLDLGLVDNRAPLLFRACVFFDYGQVYLIDPGPRPRAASLGGAGFGLNVSIGQHLDGRFSVGVPFYATRTTDKLDPRFAFGIGVQF
jgi:hemolysin activation/secretion protein